MGRKKKLKLPEKGAAFAFPLDDGRYSVCRVLLDSNSEESKVWGGSTVLVAGSSWIGHEIPAADDAALRPILHLNHHSWKNSPSLIWVNEEPPTDFVPIGSINPTVEDLANQCMSFGGWKHLTIQPLTQWRWDHDREAFLAEDVVAEQKETERYLAAQRDRETYLRQITLVELAKRSFFDEWKEYAPANAIRASRKIMKHTIKQLIEAGTDSPEANRMSILQHCIESFNELDDELSFIETVEREDICEEFEAIVHACGLGAHEELADRWRDW